jgi:biopolymer transport protein ExbD
MLPLHKPDTNPLVMPDITALLDVLFILLVFMLLTAAIKLDMLTVTLPTAGSELQSIETVKKPLVLSVQFTEQKLTYGLAEQPFESLDSLFIALAEKNNANRTLVLAVDENTPSHYLIDLLSELSAKNFSVANLLIDKKQ